MKFVIEQFGRLYKWHLIEYKHISHIVGKKNLIFTNIKNKIDELRKYGSVTKESISSLNLTDVCLLNPKAEKTLTPNDCKKVKYLVFGGILGDYPQQNRTKTLTKKLPHCLKRNLGKGQLPTDNAVYVAKQIVLGKKLPELKFKQNIEISLSKSLSVILPFKYVLVNNKPLVSNELVEYLKKRKTI